MKESKKLQKTPIEIAAHLKEQWANLPDEEKQQYKKLADEEKKRYNKELEAWETKMQKEGKDYLLKKITKTSNTVPSRLTRKPKST